MTYTGELVKQEKNILQPSSGKPSQKIGMFYDLQGNQVNLFLKGQAHGYKVGSKQSQLCNAVQALCF